MAGNKINIREIGNYEITIAKCGLLSLVWITSPKGFNRYEVRSNGGLLLATNYFWEAIMHYNDLVQ